MCVCSEEYIFLGSRLGNSLLVRFTEKDENTVITIDDSDILGKEKEKGLYCEYNFIIWINYMFYFPVAVAAAIFRDNQTIGRRIRSVWQWTKDIRSIDKLHI